MPQLIDFSNYKFNKRKNESRKYSEEDLTVKIILDDTKRIMVEILQKKNPEKLIYTLKEAAGILGIGEEFLRRRIKYGKINALKLGDKPAINIIELARILAEGV